MEKLDSKYPVTKQPIVCIIIGMAGSGKTTFLQRVNAYTHEKKLPSYMINLDPAVKKVPYGCHVDIRKTVNYNQVMKQFKLGPNGSILTSLNLFSTRFNQVIELLEKKQKDLKYVFLDTPGQIEIFTWSASGQIITDCLSSTFPTCILYVVDTPRNKSPVTFMSNMMYACSILYKTKLPFLLIFNKTDVEKHDFAVDWMTNFTAYSEALKKEKSYSSSLAFSMSLVLEEFYENLHAVGFSAMTGEGVGELFERIDGSRKEYIEGFLVDLQKRMEEKRKRNELKKKKEEGDVAMSEEKRMLLDRLKKHAEERRKKEMRALERDLEERKK